MSRPEPGWYVALSKEESTRKYIVIVPTIVDCSVVAVWDTPGEVITFVYPDSDGEDFPWHEYTLEKLND